MICLYKRRVVVEKGGGGEGGQDGVGGLGRKINILNETKKKFLCSTNV